MYGNTVNTMSTLKLGKTDVPKSACIKAVPSFPPPTTLGSISHSLGMIPNSCLYSCARHNELHPPGSDHSSDAKQLVHPPGLGYRRSASDIRSQARRTFCQEILSRVSNKEGLRPSSVANLSAIHDSTSSVRRSPVSFENAFGIKS